MLENLLKKKSYQARMEEILTRFQAPRYSTTDRNAITNPQEGQLIFCTTTAKIQVYDGTQWVDLH